MTITYIDEGKLIVQSHSKHWDNVDVLRALSWKPIYDCPDETGKVLRTADRDFPQRRPESTPNSGWAWSLGNVRRVPYRMPQLLEGIAEGKGVCIADGEKHGDSVVREGGVVSTAAHVDIPEPAAWS